MTYTEFVAKIQSCFEFKICVHYPHKLCDFKPAYGYILKEYIENYEFWGHCDNDLIWGDIRRFITEDILSKKDRILVRGHFTLYRNNDEVNCSFMNATPSYQEVFTQKKNFYFDETPATGRYWRENLGDRLYDDIIFDDIHPYRWTFVDVHKVDQDKNRKYLFYVFEEGKLFRCYLEDGLICREETMYAHFQKRQLQIETEVESRFMIIPNKIIAYNSNITLDFLIKNIKNVPFYKYYSHLKVRIGNVLREVSLWVNKY